MRPEPPPCLRQQELISEVQRLLLRISDLMKQAAELLSKSNEVVALEIDREIELELGEKERAMGALREHRREHGC